MSNTVVLIHYHALEGQHEAAARELGALIARVREAESDCGGITMVRNSDDPSRICLIEEWSSREAYLGPHMRTPHLQEFIQRAGSLFGGPPDISFWDPLGRE
ncbi:MAG TPA: antibiotic biosynthesis monooxygenase [Trueperaceae bacterium]